MKFLSLLLIAALLLPCPAWGREVEELEKTIQQRTGDLTEIQKKLQEEKRKVRKQWWQEKKVTDALDEIGRRLNRKRRELRKLNAEMKRLEKKVAQHEREIAKFEELLMTLAKSFESRLRAMYKLHRVGLVRILFSAEDYGDVLRRYKTFRLVAESDLQLLQAYQNAIAEKEKSKTALLDEKETLLSKRRQIKTKKGEIEREKRKKATMLASVKAKRMAYQKAIAELREREEDLHFLIETLRLKAASLKGVGLKSLRGQLRPPVRGTFFAPEGRKKGIGIKAPEGAEIKAIFNGKVVYASWFKGYGNLMIIAHGDGYYSIHAHASRLLKEVGDEVRMGDVVALVGSTGSIEGPMLYFEIRHHGRSENPLQWLAFPRKGSSN